MSVAYAAPAVGRRPEAFARAPTPPCEIGLAGSDVYAPAGLAEALADAPTLAALDALNRALWARWAAGGLADAAAQALAAVASARRAALKGGAAAPRPPISRALYPARRPPPRVDRAAARERRRRLAASGVMPPALASRFTTGELAALKIVADEIALRGDCRLPLGAVAARAGVSETTVRNALRAARAQGLLSVEERPRRGRPNLTNIVRMISTQWRAWILRRPPGTGCKKPQGTGKDSFSETPDATSPTSLRDRNRAFRRAGRRS